MLMNINEIFNYLPHRYPFLLIDKVIDIEDSNLMIKQKIIPISRANKATLMRRINML